MERVTLMVICFNPRSREGSDTAKYSIVVHKIVSIHAPAKGATGHVPHIKGTLAGFNPRSREGSDTGTLSMHPSALQFQSTLPRRERRDIKIG